MASRTPYFMLFALSGFTVLIYESIWSQYLKLFLGRTSYAQALVLAIFMGGMALGAWSVGRFCPDGPKCNDALTDDQQD